jgi:hypothetical protein
MPTPKGIRCPSCGGGTRVRETRARCHGRLVRYRVCGACGVIVRTHETLVAVVRTGRPPVDVQAAADQKHTCP